MATVSPSFSEAKRKFKKLLKGNTEQRDVNKKKGSAGYRRSNFKKNKDTTFSDCTTSKSLDIYVQEHKWEIDGSGSLGDPVPDLYPELTVSLRMQDSDIDQEGKASSSVGPSNHDSEENVQCVPTGSKDTVATDDDDDRCPVQESQDDSQLSCPDSQIQTHAKRKRKLSRPKKKRFLEEDEDEESCTGHSHEINMCQDASKLGTWAQCSVPSCGKWRCLKSSVNPSEIPERWVCSMNPDDHFNSCAISQETFDSQDENYDVKYTPYPSGALVWAKMAGYPWWPAMMQDDPDYGYYCETAEDNVTPVMYHVVFFGKEVSRAWVNSVCIRNFSSDDDPADMGQVSFKRKNYTRQLTAATIAARKAVHLPLQKRLEEYGFEKRFKGPIGKKAVEEAKKAEVEAEVSSESASSQEISSGGSNYSIQESTKKVKNPKRPPRCKTSNKKVSKKQSGKKMGQSKEKDSSSSSSSKKQTGKKQTFKLKGKTSRTSTSTKGTDTANVLNSFENKEDEDRKEEMDEGMSSSLGSQLAIGEGIDSGCADTNNEMSQYTSEPKQLKVSGSSQTSPLQNMSRKADGTEEDSASNPTAELPQPCFDEAPLTGNTETKGGKKRRLSADGVCKKKRKSSKEDEKERKEASTDKEISDATENLNVAFIDSLQSQGSKEQLTKGIKGPPMQNKQQKKRVKKIKSISENDSLRIEKKMHDMEYTSNESLKSSGADKTDTNKAPGGENAKERAKAMKAARIPKRRSVEMHETSDNPPQASTEPSQFCHRRDNIQDENLQFQNRKHTEKVSKESAEHKNNIPQNDKAEEATGIKDKESPQNPDFPQKTSTTNNPNSAVSSDNCTQKKSMPKLMKVRAIFKPPVSTNAAKIRKMPKLVRPQFVSPTMAKSEKRSEILPEKGGQNTSTTDAEKNVTSNNATLKRKSQEKDQHSSKAPKQAKERPNGGQIDILPEDLEVEIAKINNDIATLKEELNELDNSDPSLPEERFTPVLADQIPVSDSPEF